MYHLKKSKPVPERILFSGSCAYNFAHSYFQVSAAAVLGRESALPRPACADSRRRGESLLAEEGRIFKRWPFV